MDGPGDLEAPGFGAHGGLKDTASTDIVVHNGEAIATFYQCGEAYRLDPLTLENLGVAAGPRWTASRPTPRSTRRPAS
jgi:carotenoid cleavage dioxygenase-like enzyme